MRNLLVIVALGLAACGGKNHPVAVVPHAHEVTPPALPNPALAPTGPITGASLAAYFEARFPARVADHTLETGFGSPGVDAEIVHELAVLGIDDMAEVAALVPADFDTKGFGATKASADPSTNIAALARDLMIIHDARGYFEKAWQHHWTANGPEDFPVPAAYGIDVAGFDAFGVFGGYDDPCGGDPCSGD
jgi:hypothetical protein